MSETNNSLLLLKWWLLILNIICLCFNINTIHSAILCVESLDITSIWHTYSILLILFNSLMCLVILITCYAIINGNYFINIICLIIELLFWLFRYMLLPFIKIIENEFIPLINVQGGMAEEIRSKNLYEIIQIEANRTIGGHNPTYSLFNITEIQRAKCRIVSFDLNESFNQQQYSIKWFQLAFELNTLLYTVIYCCLLYCHSQRKLRNKQTMLRSIIR